VATTLQLSEDALRSHLALEVLDRPVHTLLTDDHLDGLADDGLANVVLSSISIFHRAAEGGMGSGRAQV
jgi:hypothetical protein